MDNKFIPYGRQEICQNDINKVVEVLKSDFLTQGPIVEKFEHAICKKVNSNHAIAVNSGTSALHIACLAVNLKKDDYLWTSPITFVASANCGLYCGANIDFIDIDSNTGLICINKLEKKLEEAEQFGKLPKVVVPVHLGGTSCDMQRIFELSKKYGFRIIEDASHAIGGQYKNFTVGSCKYSDITVFSLHPVKIITTGEGGMATTCDEELARKMYFFRSHGITKDENLFVNKSTGKWYYEQQMLGYNYRMNDICAALGLSQLKKLDYFINRRFEIISNYKKYLKDLPLKILNVPENVKSSFHLAITRLEDKDPEFHRKVFNKLRENQIGVQLHYTPVHLQPYFKTLGFKDGDFPLAEEYAHNAISLPIYPSLSDKDFHKIITTLSKIL